MNRKRIRNTKTIYKIHIFDNMSCIYNRVVHKNYILDNLEFDTYKEAKKVQDKIPEFYFDILIKLKHILGYFNFSYYYSDLYKQLSIFFLFTKDEVNIRCLFENSKFLMEFNHNKRTCFIEYFNDVHNLEEIISKNINFCLNK